MKKQNLITLVIAIIAVAAIVFIVSQQNSGAPQTSSQPANPAPTGTISTANPSSSGTPASAPAPAGYLTYVGPSFSFNYPSSWKSVRAVPLAMDNYNGAYTDAGNVPANGINFYVATTTIYGGSVSASAIPSIIQIELTGMTGLATSTAVIDGLTCTEARATAGTARNISYYCLRGQELWKIYFFYRASDSEGSANLAAYNALLASFKFLPQ